MRSARAASHAAMPLPYALARNAPRRGDIQAIRRPPPQTAWLRLDQIEHLLAERPCSFRLFPPYSLERLGSGQKVMVRKAVFIADTLAERGAQLAEHCHTRKARCPADTGCPRTTLDG